jgi:catechol 2,3-dioxygenase-like lactoylglutathione lyase family enzyme
MELNAKLDHVGILVDSLSDPLINFYRDVLGCEKPKHFRVNNSDEEMNYVYLPLPKGENYVELLAPVRGPSKELLEKRGSGSMFELCFEVDSIEEFYDELKRKGVTLCDPMGRPLPENKKWCSIPGDDNRYAYIPQDKAFGTTIEILERTTWKRSTYW